MVFGFLLLLTRCAPSFSEYFDSTTHVNSFQTHVVNDSLQLHFKTGADLRFFTDKDDIIKRLKKRDRPIDGLLAYGETKVAPHYELIVWLNTDKSIQPESSSEAVHDTLLHEQELVFMCSSLEETSSKAVKNDCESIFNSIRIGNTYREQLASVFEQNDQFRR